MKTKFLFIACSFSLFSCQNNDFIDELNPSKQQDLKENKEGLINGRYHFSSTESLSKTFDKMRQDDSFLEKTMKNLYLDGFRSVSPIGNIENDQDLI